MFFARSLTPFFFYGTIVAALSLLVVGCNSQIVVPASSSTATPVAVVVLPTLTPSPEPTLTATPLLTPTSLPLSLRQQILAEVWTTVNEHYLYADFHGLNWDALREEYAQQIEYAQSDEAFYRLLSEMVGRLDDNHSRVLAPNAAQREDVLSSGREEQVGIGVIALPLPDSLLIQHVFPDSPADRAGLEVRDRIVAVDGVFYTQASIEGPAGSKVRITVVRPGEESRDMVLTRRVIEGRIMPEAYMLPGGVGYLAITTLWVNDMANLTTQALSELTSEAPLHGLIIDLRRNPGGWRDVLVGILGHFVQGHVGDFFNRQGTIPLEIRTPIQPNLSDIPLVVLIDQGTASYAELLAAILQSEANATVIGLPSAGNTETIYSYDLTGGARLWVAQEGFHLRDGSNLEGVGVQPDLLLSQDWIYYSEADDPWIREGLRIIHAQLPTK
ncbi:S41 family peptidase [Candidatus Oscillochloris fontis]|uniref:S41 family peptidase n=1 Tax=Candidatus Oscillochloris fontis TaxID=2496868 RepID=UPI00101DF553|nr:S41 family peptidase [Candidatus Oscillochloris fontis]